MRLLSLLDDSFDDRWSPGCSLPKSKDHYGKPGYGTQFGTKFGDGDGEDEEDLRWRRCKPKYNSKVLGLGVRARGVHFQAGGGARMELYHRLVKYRSLRGEDMSHYHQFYHQQQCEHGCQDNAHCEWGFCHCDPGYQLLWTQVSCDWLTRGHVTRCSPLIGARIRTGLHPSPRDLTPTEAGEIKTVIQSSMRRSIGSIARILEAEVADSSQALEGFGGLEGLDCLETLAVVVVASMVGDTGMEGGY